MIARQFVWTDKRVLELSEKFVPSADEVGRLQREKDDDCRLFQKIAEQGHYGGRLGVTRQGLYCATPSGVLLASGNTNNPDAVARMLQKALTAWDALPEERRYLAADAKYTPKFRPESKYPLDGLVLKSVCRDLPRDSVKPVWRNAWNVEFTWFRKAEAQGFAPPELKVGASYDVPRALVSRLARFSLRDIVRGESEPFDQKSIEKAELKGEVTGIEKNIATIAFNGATRVAQKGKWHIEGLNDNKPTELERGYETHLLGRAEYDLASKKFSAFELVALGPRWGGTQFNVRGDDLKPFPMVVALRLAGETPADRVAPSYLWDYGW